MTGFGSSRFEDDKYKVQVEVKSLNSKFFDLQFRIPRSLSDKEIELRAIASKYLSRGKVLINIECEAKVEDPSFSFINTHKFKALYNEIAALAKETGYTGDDIFRLTIEQPEIANTSQLGETPEELFNVIKQELESALKKCCSFRETEGKNLETELRQYIGKIDLLRKDIGEKEKVRATRLRERLEGSIAKLIKPEDIDENRMEQEIIFYLEKLDITEELVRLESHVKHFDGVLKEDNCGKKLGFLSQELGREINTIGSKANDAEIQKTVVLMKEELEKIKEQSLNVL